MAFIPPLRLRSPFWQNVIMGVIIGLTAGMYQSLNALGAGGLRANSAHTVQVVNATLCATWFVASMFSGTVLNWMGPAFTAFFGVVGYAAYVAGLWYFDKTGHEWFPILGGVLIGLSAGLIFVVMGSIAMSYSEEEERGAYITMSQNLQALGAAVAGLIDLLINRNHASAEGVPMAVYIVVLCLMGCACLLALLLRPATEIVREDGTHIAHVPQHTFRQELQASYDAIRENKLLWLMIPAFLPSECILVYAGSTNAFRNNLRTRSLLSFTAVILQMPAAYGLRLLLDHAAWRRRTRSLLGVVLVGVPLMAAWVWQMVQVRKYDRHNTGTVQLVDWADAGFVSDFFLFTLTWVSSSLFQYVILYFLSCMTNSPRKSANYAGIYRGFLAAGEAVGFGVDSAKTPYLTESGILLAFYTAGVFIFLYIGLVHITETEYFAGEVDVVVPEHVLAEHHVVEGHTAEDVGSHDGSTGHDEKDMKTETDIRVV